MPTIGRARCSEHGADGDGDGVDEVTTVLVTGGGGFIGSHVTAELPRRGRAVRVLDNFSTGSRENLAAVGGDVELVEGDVRSYERTHAATQGIDCVIHLAALPSVPRSIQDPLTTSAVKVTARGAWCSRRATPARRGWSLPRLRPRTASGSPRQLNVFGRLRRPEGADVYLHPGGSGLLSHAHYLLGGGRVKVFLAAVGADHGRHILGHECELAALQRDRCRAGLGLALAANGAHHRLLLLKLASHRKQSGS